MTTSRPAALAGWFLLTMLLAAALPTVTQAQADEVRIWKAKVKVGDNARWADPTWPDDDWTTQSLYPAPDTQAVYWVRARIVLDSADAAHRPLATRLDVLASSEIYWDGVQIGRNGQVGDGAEAEVPGQIRTVHPVPDSLATPGEHVLALRLSNFHLPSSLTYTFYGWTVGNYQEIVRPDPDLVFWPLFYLGAFALLTLFAGGLYLFDREQSVLGVFGALCLVVTLLLSAEMWRWTLGYPYDWHLLRLQVITGLTAAAGVLLPFFFSVQFQGPRQRWVLSGTALLIALSLLLPSYDAKTFGIQVTAFVASAGVVGWALIHRKRGAVPAAVGVGGALALMAGTGQTFVYDYFFPALGLVVGFFLVAFGLQMRAQREARDAAQRRVTRLRLELVKKHLQPHFLLNTLTAATEWIEQDPETGVRFIHALADELRTLSDVTDETLIPLRTELHLCRRYLEVMGYRQDRTYRLDAEVEMDAEVPPATIHTLIENAFTHNDFVGETQRNEPVCFRLSESQSSSRRQYVLDAPRAGGSLPAEATTTVGDESAVNNGTGSPDEGHGLGLRYVRARLAEAYGDAWHLTESVSDETWRTVLTLPADD